MSTRTKELAAAFDRSFAAPAEVDRARGAVALSIMAAGVPYLLRLEEVSHVARAPKIRPLPGGSALQLGLVGLRGGLLVVFSLPALLGQSASVGATPWIAVVRGVAIAFDALDGQQELEGSPPNLLDLDALLRKAQ